MKLFNQTRGQVVRTICELRTRFGVVCEDFSERKNCRQGKP